MNDEQPDELSEGATPPSFRPAGIHLFAGGYPPQAGKTVGEHVFWEPTLWTSKGSGGVQGQQAPRLGFSMNSGDTILILMSEIVNR